MFEWFIAASMAAGAIVLLVIIILGVIFIAWSIDSWPDWVLTAILVIIIFVTMTGAIHHTRSIA